MLVATSVAEEGLDVGACNLVIRYDAMSTVTALIQSRGRARDKDSTFVVIHMDGAVEQKMLMDLETQEVIVGCCHIVYLRAYSVLHALCTCVPTVYCMPLQARIQNSRSHSLDGPQANMTAVVHEIMSGEAVDFEQRLRVSCLQNSRTIVCHEHGPLTRTIVCHEHGPLTGPLKLPLVPLAQTELSSLFRISNWTGAF